jgi:DNA-directed RNA polymerase subunit RPC12/RpoP
MEVKTYACIKCGHPFVAIPPDDMHIVVLLEPCQRGDSIQIPYDCQNCEHVNIRHWDIAHKTNEFDRISVS